MMIEASPSDAFIEQMGLITQSDGGPRIAGRIFGLLLVEGRAFSLSEMSERLRISKASASTNARLLLAGGLLKLAARPGDRQDYYELGNSPFAQMVDRISVRMRRSAAQVREAEALIPDQDLAAKQRVQELADFYLRSADLFKDWAEHLARAEALGPNETSRGTKA